MLLISTIPVLCVILEKFVVVFFFFPTPEICFFLLKIGSRFRVSQVLAIAHDGWTDSWNNLSVPLENVDSAPSLRDLESIGLDGPKNQCFKTLSRGGSVVLSDSSQFCPEPPVPHPSPIHPHDLSALLSNGPPVHLVLHTLTLPAASPSPHHHIAASSLPGLPAAS